MSDLHFLRFYYEGRTVAVNLAHVIRMEFKDGENGEGIWLELLIQNGKRASLMMIPGKNAKRIWNDLAKKLGLRR